MIGAIGYICACFLIGIILTFVVNLFRPIRQNDEWKPAKWMFGLGALVALLPYGYAEVVTRTLTPDITPVLQEVADEAGVVGKIDYHKVTLYGKGTAHVVIVCEDLNNWGSMERTVLGADLKRNQEGAWEAERFSVINSYMRGKDHNTLPPYW